MPIVFLPTDCSYASVYRYYVQAFKEEYGEEKQHEKKISATEDYLAHLSRAKQERNYYNTNIIHAVEDGKRNSNKTKTQNII
ncbi:unnamed protein product [Rhizophagus irregularis]|nr:unnamed protein product [Rhizophagus irregularis]